MKLNSDCSLFGEGISSPAASLTPNVPDLISLTHATRFGIVSSNLSNFPAVSLSFFRGFDAAAGVSASHTFHWATSLRDISIEPRTNSRTSFLDRWYGANSIASTISLNRASSTAALAVKALAFDGGFLFARLVECGGWVRSVFDRTSSLCRFSKSDHLRVKDAACRQLETASIACTALATYGPAAGGEIASFRKGRGYLAWRCRVTRIRASAPLCFTEHRGDRGS